MYASVWTSLLNAASAWGPWLSLLGLILFAAQRAWVAHLKHRGADYLRAQAELLRAGNEPKIKRLEIVQHLLLAEMEQANMSPEHASDPASASDNSRPLPLKSAQRTGTPPDDMDKAA